MDNNILKNFDGLLLIECLFEILHVLAVESEEVTADGPKLK